MKNRLFFVLKNSVPLRVRFTEKISGAAARITLVCIDAQSFLWKTFFLEKFYYFKVATTMISLHCKSILSHFKQRFFPASSIIYLKDEDEKKNIDSSVKFSICIRCAQLERFESACLC